MKGRKKEPLKEVTKVTHKKLGNRRAYGVAYPETGEIELDERLAGLLYLEICIHEGSHIFAPEWSEEQVTLFSKKMSKYLWNKIDWDKIIEPQK